MEEHNKFSKFNKNSQRVLEIQVGAYVSYILCYYQCIVEKNA